MHRILIVDDDVAVTHGLARLLRRDYKVTTASSGEAALALIDREGPYSVIISDFLMPGMNGVELFARLRDSEAGSSRIMLTGQNAPQVTIDSINRAGVTCFLTKPVPPPELLASVAAAARQAEQTFEHAGSSLQLTNADLSLLSGLNFATALYPVFQPKIDLATGRAIGVEALSRMRPEIGAIPPHQFCAFYEQSPRALEFSCWILKESLAAAGRWSAAGASLQVAVNIPPSMLRSATFGNAVVAALDQQGLPGSLLQFEITERGAPALGGTPMEVVSQLRRHGVSLAVDDFGTGYDSLLTLTALGVEVLKLDGWLVRDLAVDPRAGHILQAVLDLARNLQIKVVAEGVESLDQVSRLRDLRCDAAQGYFFARPMPETDLLAWQQQTCPTSAS